jgi:nicotinamide mononucleotide adenylyltransferase
MELDESNPFTAEEVEQMLRVAFKDEIANNMVDTQILKRDIASINYGRGVGYEVINHTAAAPEHVKRISATEIRRQIRAGESGWRSMVMDGVAPFLEAKFNG